MLYRNKSTGTIIDVRSELGGNWEKVEDAKQASPAAKKTTKKAGEKNGGTVRNARGRK